MSHSGLKVPCWRRRCSESSKTIDSANARDGMIQVMVFGAAGSSSCSLLVSMALSLEEPLYWLTGGIGEVRY